MDVRTYSGSWRGFEGAGVLEKSGEVAEGAELSRGWRC